MQSYQLRSVGWGHARNLWSKQPLAEDVITGLEFPLDLPMWSLVGQKDETKNLRTASYQLENADSHTLTEVKQVTIWSY